MSISYTEHLEFLIRQELGSRAERQGFQDAKSFEQLPKFSPDKYEQGRYADGYFSGKEKIRFDVRVDTKENNL